MRGGILYSKEGFERQIDDLLRVGNNGMGIIFYLTRREEGDKIGVEVTLELLSSYVCIIDQDKRDKDLGNILQ